MKKVFIVDDDAGIVLLLQKRLEAAGYEVITAGDGKEGLKKMKVSIPDIALLDVMMPGLDGYSLLGEIRSEDALRGMPLLILTAREDLGGLFKTEGVAGFFSKPVNIDEVMAKVREIVGS